MLDHHNIVIFYDGFEAVYKSLCLVPIPGSAFPVAYATSVLTFPPSLRAADYPYRRILAWRMRHAAVKNASTLDTERLDMLVRMSELSEAAELATEAEEEEEDDEGSEMEYAKEESGMDRDAYEYEEGEVSERYGDQDGLL